jgi:hypothetical protein
VFVLWQEGAPEGSDQSTRWLLWRRQIARKIREDVIDIDRYKRMVAVGISISHGQGASRVAISRHYLGVYRRLIIEALRGNEWVNLPRSTP